MASLADAFLNDIGDFGGEDDDAAEHSDTLLADARDLDLELADGNGAGHAHSQHLVADLLAKLSSLTATDRAALDREALMSLVSRATALAQSAESELLHLNASLRALYAARLSELDAMVPSPTEYARIVTMIGGRSFAPSDAAELESALAQLVEPTRALTLTLTIMAQQAHSQASLSPDQYTTVQQCCSWMLALQDVRTSVSAFLASEMARVAPNLVELLSADLSAALVSEAGGLKALSEIPACNIQMIGGKRARAAGMSTVSAVQHVGMIVNAPVLATVPRALKARAIRQLANKVALLARVDLSNEFSDGSKGREILAAVQAKIESWLAPAPLLVSKALPAPETSAARKKRRGGRRYRAEKARTAQTELAKQKNRMAFGEEQLVDEYTGEEFGMAGRHAGKNVDSRIRQPKQQSSKQRLSAAMKSRLEQTAKPSRTMALAAAVPGPGTATVVGASGLSSIAFTPTHGISLAAAGADMPPQPKRSRYF